MPSANVQDTEWIMRGGTEGKAKGLFRNLMFSYIARAKSDQESSTLKQIKYAVSFPGGLLVKTADKPSGDREADPDKFLPMLGFVDTDGNNIDKERIDTFEKLVDYMKSDPKFNHILAGFKDYISTTR